MLKNQVRSVRKEGLNYLIGEGGKPIRFKPWIGDAFSFLYDFLSFYNRIPALCPQSPGAQIGVLFRGEVIDPNAHPVQF